MAVIVHDVSQLRQTIGTARCALIPTMGGVHEGHLALVRKGRLLADVNVVSIYVNPLQFGVNEDFDSYPRQLQHDCEKLQHDADVIFAPHNLYTEKQTVTIALPPLANQLCGQFRPGFFEGVTTVVCKLFHCVQPQIAIFGQKDFQQLHFIRLMSRQLNFNIDIVDVAIVRDADGLAMSSRNRYLTSAQRQQAVIFPQTLTATATAIENGENIIQATQNAAYHLQQQGFKVDYVEARDYETLAAPTQQSLIILAAITLGKARLIDNIVCQPFLHKE